MTTMSLPKFLGIKDKRADELTKILRMVREANGNMTGVIKDCQKIKFGSQAERDFAMITVGRFIQMNESTQPSSTSIKVVGPFDGNNEEVSKLIDYLEAAMKKSDSAMKKYKKPKRS